MQTKYDDIMDHGARALVGNSCSFDPYLQIPPSPDTRRGLTLIARLHGDVKMKILEFMRTFSSMEPEQYVHDADSLHITILSVISAREEYILPTNLDHYVSIISEALSHCCELYIDFDGVTSSPGCILAQGYPVSDQGCEMLENMRCSLREKFRESDVEHNMDARYPASTAHCSIIRYRAPLRDNNAVLQHLQHHRRCSFGRLHVTQLELVYNDWYLRPCNTQVVAVFPLSS